MIPYVTRTSKAGFLLGSYGLEGVDRKNALPIDAHAERVYVVEGVAVFDCFPRFLALLRVLFLRVLYFFVCGVDYHGVFRLCETEDTLLPTAEEELRGNRPLLVRRRAQSH